MDTAALTFEDLWSSDDAALAAQAYETVLRPAFRPEELTGPQDVAPGPRRVLSVALDAKEEPVAAAVTDLGPTQGEVSGDADRAVGVALLSHLAVRASGQGGGVGSAMMGHLQRLWTRLELPLVLGEVHDPRGHAESDTEHPMARLRFYERCGARVLDVPWVQPSLAPGQQRVPDMLLLALHGPFQTARGEPGGDPHAGRGAHARVGRAGEGRTGEGRTGEGRTGEAGDTVSPPAIHAWASLYYRSAEGCAPTQEPHHLSHDPAVTLLTQMAQRERIAVLPLAKWRQVRRLEARAGA